MKKYINKSYVSNKNGGITLIALIITIIILVILTSIIIMVLKNNRLIDKSKQAKDIYQKRSNEESNILNEYENIIDEKSLESNKTKDQNENQNESIKNIWEKLYDIGFSIDEIISDNTIFQKILSNENGINYMINSNKIMQSIANNQNAMEQLGKNSQAAFKVISNSSLYTIITSSQYCSTFDNNVISVPTLTSNSSSGTASSSQIYANGYEAYKAFDKKNGEGYKWAGQGNSYDTNRYLQYQFSRPNYIYKMTILNHTWTTNECPTYFELWGSNDEKNWDTIMSKTKVENLNLGATNQFLIPYTGKAYKYYRICGLSCTSGNTCIGELQFYCVTNQ